MRLGFPSCMYAVYTGFGVNNIMYRIHVHVHKIHNIIIIILL